MNTHEHADATGVASETSSIAREATFDLLLGERERAEAAAGLFAGRSGWMPAVELCSLWGVLPQLHRRLGELGVSPDEPARDQLRRRTTAVFLQSAARLHQGARGLAAVGDAGIDAVAIKGMAAIARLYSGPRDRSVADTDVLVRGEDVEEVVAALHRAGFRPDFGGSLRGQLRSLRGSPSGNRALYMLAADGSEIDVHWRLGRLSTEAILDDSCLVEVYSRRIRVVSDAHGFLIAAHHLLRNGLAPDLAARDLLDGCGWLKALLANQEVGPVVRQATDWGLGAPVLALLQVLSRFRPTDPAVASATMIADGIAEDEHRRARALTELFFRQLAEGPLSPAALRISLGTLRFLVLRQATGRSRSYRWLMRTRNARDRRASSPTAGRPRFRRWPSRTEWRLVWALKRAQARAFR